MQHWLIAALLVACYGCGTDATVGGPPDAGSSADSGTSVVGSPCLVNDDCNTNPCTLTAVCIENVCHAKQRMVKEGQPCNDSNECTTSDKCGKDGECASTPVDCDDKNPCTSDSCEKVGGCKHLFVTAACDDGSACTTDDKCDGGVCVSTLKSCDDTNACTSDSCDPTKGCMNVNNANPCDDGNVCTDGDACKDGACAAGTAKMCDDGKQCTVDMCEAAKGCTHALAAAGQLCDDGIVKTTGDMCNVSGQCLGKTTTACAVNSDCSGLDVATKCATYVCDVSLGLCKPQATLLTDDNNACTLETCNPVDGMTLHTPLDISCDDGNMCTVGDICKKGACVAGQFGLPCDDGNACTLDSCDPLAGGCVHLTKQCDDGNQYTENSCLPKFGCQFLPQKYLVTCQVPSDVPDAKTSWCVVKVMYATVSGNKTTISNTLESEGSLSISVESVCAAVKGGAMWLINPIIYGPDGVPLGAGGGGGANGSVKGPDGKTVADGNKSEQLGMISSGDAPDLIVTANMLKDYCK